MIEGFDEIVLAWEKHELFYKELYEKKKGNPAEYRRFLSQLNVEDLREEGLVVPDLYDAELQDSYGVKTPEDLLYAMVDNAGEYQNLVAWIQKFQGFTEDFEVKIKRAKNS